MKRKILLSLIAIGLAVVNYAQTPAGSAFVNPDPGGGNPGYINCGNNGAFNMSGEFTIEAWINPYTFGDDRKLIGRTNLSFNSGFVFGFENGLYVEIWQPGRTEMKVGTLPLFNSWVHVAMTFSPGNTMVGYINGQMVGSQAVAASNLATNTENLIIGAHPWGSYNGLAFLGEVDEIRVWNIVKSESEIQANMHRSLAGNESNLVALYNLNEGAGTSVSNATGIPNLGGTMVAPGAWQTSYAVIESATMEVQEDVHAVWLGMTNDPVADLRVSNTTNGMSIVTVVDSLNHILYGHDNESGVSTADLPQAAIDENFELTNRNWYVEAQVPGQAFSSQVVFDLANAADGGIALNGTQPVENYTLFHRTGTSGDFVAIQAATALNAGKVVFDGVDVTTGYYAIGVGDNSLFGGVGSINEDLSSKVEVYPNPALANLNINLKWIDANVSEVSLTNSLGQVVLTNQEVETVISLNVSNLESGIYTVRVLTDRGIAYKKVAIK